MTTELAPLLSCDRCGCQVVSGLPLGNYASCPFSDCDGALRRGGVKFAKERVREAAERAEKERQHAAEYYNRWSRLCDLLSISVAADPETALGDVRELQTERERLRSAVSYYREQWVPALVLGALLGALVAWMVMR